MKRPETTRDALGVETAPASKGGRYSLTGWGAFVPDLRDTYNSFGLLLSLAFRIRVPCVRWVDFTTHDGSVRPRNERQT